MEVSLKKNNLEIFTFLAEKNAVLEGITDPDEFNQRVEELIYTLAEEAFSHSLTPSGNIGTGNNPLSKNLSDELPTAQLVKKFFTGESKEVRKLEKELTRSINSIVGIFMKMRISPKLLKKHSKKTYYKKSDSITINKENAREIEINRYFDFMVSGLLYGWLYEFFQQDVSDYENLLYQGIATLGKDDKVEKVNLGKNSTRKAFIQKFFKVGQNQSLSN